MKKFYDLGAKTGLNKAEVNRIARFGVLGLLAFGLAGLAACFKTQKTPPAAAKPGTLQDIANSVNTSTGTAEQSQDDCGPYQGYPCGTRYYTVSRSDFGRAA
jgi:hypothetical protein